MATLLVHHGGAGIPLVNDEYELNVHPLLADYIATLPTPQAQDLLPLLMFRGGETNLYCQLRVALSSRPSLLPTMAARTKWSWRC